VDRLREAGVDIPRLARAGVEVFFTQVFRDAYFHADMHPGNILVATEAPHHGKYIALDFGIMGTLSERDQSYLAQNFLAFFRRDYRRVATAHLESGWVPADTRVDELEAEIRSCSAGVRPAPLRDLAGRVLLCSSVLRVGLTSRSSRARAAAEDAANVGLGRARSQPDLGYRLALPRAMDERPDRTSALKRRLLAEAPYIVAALPSCRVSSTSACRHG
jgi:hypothetical protein